MLVSALLPARPARFLPQVTNERSSLHQGNRAFNRRPSHSLWLACSCGARRTDRATSE